MAFVRIKYGNNQEALFNPNCKTLVLLDDIKKRCKCSTEAVVDLSDEKGEIKHLQEHKIEYANTYLKEREIFILLEIEKNEEQETKYIPLLKNISKLYPDIKGRLETSRGADGYLDVGKNTSRQSTRSLKHNQSHQNGNKEISASKHKKQQDGRNRKKSHVKPQH